MGKRGDEQAKLWQRRAVFQAVQDVRGIVGGAVFGLIAGGGAQARLSDQHPAWTAQHVWGESIGFGLVVAIAVALAHAPYKQRNAARDAYRLLHFDYDTLQAESVIDQARVEEMVDAAVADVAPSMAPEDLRAVTLEVIAEHEEQRRNQVETTRELARRAEQAKR